MSELNSAEKVFTPKHEIFTLLFNLAGAVSTPIIAAFLLLLAGVVNLRWATIVLIIGALVTVIAVGIQLSRLIKRVRFDEASLTIERFLLPSKTIPYNDVVEIGNHTARVGSISGGWYRYIYILQNGGKTTQLYDNLMLNQEELIQRLQQYTGRKAGDMTGDSEYRKTSNRNLLRFIGLIFLVLLMVWCAASIYTYMHP